MGEFVKATIETIYMMTVSTIVSVIIGLPLGIILVLTQKNGIWENSKVFGVLDLIINILRSIPFIILMIVLFGLSRFIVGRSTGTTATIVPLSIAAAPFVARIMEQGINEVDKGIIEAAKAMGTSTWEMVTKVLLPEAFPSIISGLTITVINIVGYTAMAGAIGGGGLGDLAIRYGIYRKETKALYLGVIIIILIVQLVQAIGNRFYRAVDKR